MDPNPNGWKHLQARRRRLERDFLGGGACGARMGQGGVPALLPRRLGTGAGTVRGDRSGEGPGRHPGLPGGKARRPAHASRRGPAAPGRVEGDPSADGEGRQGAPLSPGELLLVGQTARTGERIRKYFEERRGRYPRLAHHAKEIPALRDLAEEIEQKIDPSGNLTDRASPSLGPLRRQLLEVRGRLQKTAEGILSSAKYARHLQESYATVRSGRLVIPFKAAAKGLFQGIVHDTSQSGQTVFFEPEELVYLNNEVRMAELEVEREIARILAELTARVARKEGELLLAL